MPSPETDKWTAGLVLAHLRELMAAHDARYVSMFTSSKEAVATAFASSEKAIRDTLAAVEKSTAAAFVAAEKAVALAEANAERWREDAKMWRATVEVQRAEMATKTQVEALKERLDRGEGASGGMRDVAGWIVSALMAAVAVATALYK